MMTCVIIDDVAAAIEVLQRYTNKIPDLKLLKTFRVPSEAVSYLNDNLVDFILLDINMPGTSGIELYYLLERKPLIIFTTAYSEFAAESYNLDALDYLLKPVTFSRFLKAIDKVREKISLTSLTDSQSGIISIKSGTKVYRLVTKDILFLKKEDNYFEVNTATQKILIRENMKSIFSLLPAQHFVRVHKSYIVNMSLVTIAEKHQLTIGSHKIPIGLSYKAIVESLLNG